MTQEVTYPSGWYHFDSSLKIKRGKIYNYQYFNTALVCFRNSQGQVSVFDAYCPHLGAHLGFGGKIENDNIVCPFHGWKYNAMGQCVDIPYCKTIPKKAILKRYMIEEINSSIYIHSAGDENSSRNFITSILDKKFKPFLTMQLSTIDLRKWSERLKSAPFHFKSLDVGLLLAESDFGVDLLVSITPINNEKTFVTLSFHAKRLLKNLCPFSVKRRVQKRFGFLFNSASAL